MLRPLRNKSAFTLVEAVFCVMLLGITVGAMLGAFSIGRISVVKANHYIEAMNLLRQRMEEIKNLSYTNIVSVASQSIVISIGPDLTSGTADDLSGTILVEVVDKNDLDADNNTTETTIDLDGDGTNEACKPVYVTISWDSPLWTSNNIVSEELETLISEADE